MIVVAEDAYAGTLAVRQVSEVALLLIPARALQNSTPYRTRRTF